MTWIVPYTPRPLLAPPPGPTVGAAREGLNSAFRRLCEKNQLSVGDVFSQLILAPQGAPTAQLTKMSRAVYLVNRGGSQSRKLIAGIKALTTMGGVENLTLQELVELKGVGTLAVSPYRKWCGACFDNDLETELGPYDRLAWTIDDVDACHVHRAKLRSTCQTCGAGPFPPLTGREISGRCPKCLSWLGGAAIPLDDYQDEYSQYLIWVARSFADLLESPVDHEIEIAQGFRTALITLSARHFGGVFAHLATAIKRNRSVVSTWLGGSSAPSWQALCELSFVFQVPLRDLLTGETDGIAISSVRPLPFAASERLTQPRKLPQRRSVEDVREFLLRVLRGELPSVLTIREAAARIGVHARELARVAPDETAQLSSVLAARRLTMRERRQASREQTLREEVGAAVSRLLKGAGRVSRRAVDAELACHGILVRRGEAPLVRSLVQTSLIDLQSCKPSGNK